ncbi:MAG: VOC family protein [Acidimicrobiales bacterium]
MGVVYLLDQISIDIPHGAFDDECRFWSDLTGWPIHGGSVPEFRVLQRPDGMALRILLQRLDDDDPATLARAHLDFAVGEHGDAIAAWHQTLGATFARQGRRWITLTDPAGLPYCLTERDPVTGTL